MFRMLVVQALYRLSDDQAEYELRDRLSCMRFAELALHEPVPGAKTIRLFREQLTRAGEPAPLFARCDAILAARLSRHRRADRRCDDRRGAQAADSRRLGYARPA